jgi:hypothetical protein
MNRPGSRLRKSGLQWMTLDMSKIPRCNCGGTNFAPVGSDGAMEYVALQCESCCKEYVFRVRGRKLTMLRQID